jgi:hypothetical protein
MDISSTDKIDRMSKAVASAGTLLPDTSINSLDGGINLGAILFTFVLYNGLFGKAGRPADWVLPIAAKVAGEEQSLWFKDFSDGFSFQVPPTVEFLRFGFFAVLGWFTNLAWIAALDGCAICSALYCTALACSDILALNLLLTYSNLFYSDLLCDDLFFTVDFASLRYCSSEFKFSVISFS